MLESSDHVQIVAIKVLKENATREAEEDFIREVEIMSAFRHDNILSLLGMVVRGNVFYFVEFNILQCQCIEFNLFRYISQNTFFQSNKRDFLFFPKGFEQIVCISFKISSTYMRDHL